MICLLYTKPDCGAGSIKL